MRKIIKRILLIGLAVLLLAEAAWTLYVNDYYRADQDAIAGMNEGVEFTWAIWGDGTRAYLPADQEYTTAIIFYPGGKVECDAYEPLLTRCAEQGILCLLVEMPGNLAVLDVNAAARVRAFYPEVEHWYLAGHSLGGSMAAAFAAEHAWVEGLILLAAYSTEDVTDLRVLSVVGTEDRVMDLEKYEQYRSNLPGSLVEVVLEGGNHACFGVYGEQDGDGTAELTNLEQIQQTVEAIAGFVQ